jgi:hypothetical protein
MRRRVPAFDAEIVRDGRLAFWHTLPTGPADQP